VRTLADGLGTVGQPMGHHARAQKPRGGRPDVRLYLLGAET